MGVVYKAQDTSLDRFVALKFLPERLSNSEQDRARFLQEAKAASALNHPNICTIHGIEEHDKQMFIVMELVEGQTLRDKKGSISFKQAIDIGIQLADGLAAAHEKGIVHRDIKPDNIMIRKDGIVQIMDFGLAKLRGVSRLTKEGSTVGTAGYMSPEQVQGLDADHRSDIFSLGVLLYELFTGQLPFKGLHETALAYEIVNVDSLPMSSVKPEINAELDRIVLECMEKDPNERTQSVKQIAIDLKRFKRESSRSRVSMVRPAYESSESAPTKKLINWERIGWAVVITVCAVGWILSMLRKTGENTTTRLNISAINSPGQEIIRSDVSNHAISPDGRFLVYILSEAGTSQLYIRSLNNFQANPIKGTENGNSPFFSPDGQWIGFTADGKLKKIPASGGTAETICDAPAFRGGSWGIDNRIYFSPAFASSIMSVSATGGDVRIFSILDSTRKERTHRWPQVLPDGKWVLYTIGDQSNPNSYVDASFAFQSLETGERHILDVHGEMALYVEPGYLIVARNGALLAAPFSLKDFRVTQPLATVISEVSGDPGSGISYFSISGKGHLTYLSGSQTRELELLWVSRDGKETPVSLAKQPYDTPRVSPDGTKLALTIGLVAGSDNDIWIYDLRTSALNRLTFEKKMFDPVWSKDGKKLYYASAVEGKEGIMVQASDGSSEGSSVLSSKLPRFPISISPNGTQLLINFLGGPTDGDLYKLNLNEDKECSPLLNSAAYEYGGCISPDGRYIAYGSNESGTLEAFVRTYPDLKGKWQVSVKGGLSPIWSPDGKEIFFVSTVGKMMSVSVKTFPAFSADQPRELFDVSQMYFPNNPVTNFDISPDGKRFIMVRNAHIGTNVTSFNMVQNWIAELQREMPGK